MEKPPGYRYTGNIFSLMPGFIPVLTVKICYTLKTLRMSSNLTLYALICYVLFTSSFIETEKRKGAVVKGGDKEGLKEGGRKQNN